MLNIAYPWNYIHSKKKSSSKTCIPGASSVNSSTYVRAPNDKLSKNMLFLSTVYYCRYNKYFLYIDSLAFVKTIEVLLKSKHFCCLFTILIVEKQVNVIKSFCQWYLNANCAAFSRTRGTYYLYPFKRKISEPPFSRYYTCSPLVGIIHVVRWCETKLKCHHKRSFLM
jgi:hypothetical protein